MNLVITGATKGIGKAIVEIFAKNGWNIIFCSRNQEELTSLEEELKRQYKEQSFYSLKTDVSDKAELKEFGKFSLKKFDKIDVLINNAGVFIPGELLSEPEGRLEQMIETNLYSAYQLTRIIAPSMQYHRKGHIINICSIASKIAYPNGGSYSISKFAMLGMSKVLREELKESNVRVTSVLPGATWSYSWKGVDLPKDRLMDAADIAKSVFAATTLGDSAVVEEIIIRPQLGDL